jgi:hypothetical protein
MNDSQTKTEKVNLQLSEALLMFFYDCFVGHLIGDIPKGKKYDSYRKIAQMNLLELKSALLKFKTKEQVKEHTQELSAILIDPSRKDELKEVAHEVIEFIIDSLK